ncbi:Cytochrome P450 [Nocardioides exalbidus]|uniref:Cytochrome P450 n=1 Tax=Nocardioides exalbidus TaxID=402596 RepID=A0A1H4JZD6_9ACTN|nr:cytochrome P450 [Nocardioides exalbidus]SEB51376.1 Cytochrome P450 [Nocardioides exalbidus]
MTSLAAPPAPRMVGRTVGREVRSGVHWGVSHGLPTLFLRRAAGRGDLQARLIRVGSMGTDEVFDLIEEIRASGPLYRSRIGYVATSHAAVRQVLTSDDFRTGFPADEGLLGRISRWAAPTTLHPVAPPSLLVTEPPDHTRYRKLVTRVFTMRAVERLRERTEEIAADLLDGLADRADRPVDLVQAYCAVLPVTVIAEILGVPEHERARVLEFGQAAAPSLDLGLGYGRYRSVNRALARFDAWLGDHLEHLRRHPGDDLLSQLVTVQEDGQGLSETELRATAGLVLAAGFETTVNLLGNGIALLHDHPDERARVTADPALWPNVVEEALRLDPPVLLTGRMAVRDTVLAGQEVRAGSMVTAILGGANRDREVFADPLRFDVGRANARDHIAFSAGRHHCLGAQLARMEGEVGLRAIWQRYPDLRLEPGARRRETRILRGFESLPATLRP